MTDGSSRRGTVERRSRTPPRTSPRPSAAPPRSSSTPRRGDPLDPMRHSAAHVMAEAVLDLFPGTKLGIGPAIQDGFYYDFQLDRPLKPDDLAAIEARMAESVAADHPFVRRELPPEEGRAFFAERGPALQGRDPRRPRREGEGRRRRRCRRCRSTSTAPFVDLCKGPARRRAPASSGRSSSSRSPARTGAATRSARCSSASTARSGRPRRSSTSTCGGARRRRSATTAGSASSSTCTASTTCRPGRPSGTRRAR